MNQHFENLKSKKDIILEKSKTDGVQGFISQEILRFISIAGTLTSVPDFKLDENSSIDERYITHILTRSLLENFFWILYILDDENKINSRYESLVNSFKIEYRKLLNEEKIKSMTEYGSLLPADTSWSHLKKPLDVNSMLTQIKDSENNRLNYLYFTYRLTSFDTHGKSMNAIFISTFNKDGAFPVLKIKKVIDIISEYYLNIFTNP